VFDPEGADLGVIDVPGIPTNPTFGGINQDTLYVSTRFALVGTPTPGNSVLLRIDGMPIPGMPGRP
jgi:sugar lactone lactonase YvrE